MPHGLTNVEWLAQNAARAYPLAETSSRTSTTGDLVIPDSLLLGLTFPVHWGLAVQAENFFIKSLRIGDGGIGIVLGYDDGSDSPPDAAVATVLRATHAEYDPYTLTGVDDFADCVGEVVVGRLDDLVDAPVGVHSFSPAAGRLATHTVRPMVKGLSSIVVVNGSERSDPIYGLVEFHAGTNFRLSVAQVTGQDPQIRFDAIAGDGLNNDCGCVEELAPCVKSINGVGPDNTGNIALVGNDCLTIEPLTAGLKLSDVCAQPCCGCPELTALEQRVEAFETGRRTLESFVTRLDAQVSQMIVTVLGARLRDEGCFN